MSDRFCTESALFESLKQKTVNQYILINWDCQIAWMQGKMPIKLIRNKIGITKRREK